MADTANHLYSQMAVAASHGIVLVSAARAAEAIEILEATATTCREKKFVGQLIIALRDLGRAYVLAGRPAEAIALEQECIDLQETAKVYVNRGLQHTTLVEAHLALGNLGQAAAVLESALDFAQRNGERGTEGWARLTGGELALRRGDRATAARYFDEAQEIAEELGMRPLVERCRAALREVG